MLQLFIQYCINNHVVIIHKLTHQCLVALLHMSYNHDTNCMNTCYNGNIGKKYLANCGDSPSFLPAKVLYYTVISQVYEQNITIVHQDISHYFQQNTVIVKHFID